MRIIGKIIALPFILVLSIGVAILTFLFCTAASILQIISGIIALLGVVAIFTTGIIDGCVILFLAFLISPFGLPKIAEWIIDKLDDLNYSLKTFVTT